MTLKKYILQSGKYFIKVSKINTVARTAIESATLFETKEEARRMAVQVFITYGKCEIKEMECKLC